MISASAAWPTRLKKEIDHRDEPKRVLLTVRVSDVVTSSVPEKRHDTAVDLHRAELLLIVRAALQFSALNAESLLHQRYANDAFVRADGAPDPVFQHDACFSDHSVEMFIGGEQV